MLVRFLHWSLLRRKNLAMKLAMSDLGILSMQCPRSSCILAMKESFASPALMLVWFGFRMANFRNTLSQSALIPSNLQAFGLHMVGLGSAFGASCDFVDAILWASHQWKHRHRDVADQPSNELFSAVSFRTLRVSVELFPPACQTASSWIAVRRSKVGSDPVVPCRVCFSYQPCSGHCWFCWISKDCGGQVPCGRVVGWAVDDL